MTVPSPNLSTKTWSDVLHLLPAWTWETDADYRLRQIDMQFERIAGVPAEQLIGHCILDAADRTHPEEAGLDTYMDALRAQQPIASMVYEKILLNGDKIVMMDSAQPVFKTNGAFVGYKGVSFNMSRVLDRSDNVDSVIAALHLRTTELENNLSARNDEIAAANRLMRDVIESMGEGLMVTSGSDAKDPGNRITVVNKAYRDLFGLGPSDVFVGQAVGDFLQRLLERGDFPEEAGRAGGELEDVQTRLQNGEQVLMYLPSQNRSYYCKSTPGRDGGLVLVHTDVTELHAQNDALRAARDAAEVANAAKSNFLATMSHEIRTPMNGIVGMAELLADMDLNGEQAEAVETIRSSASALASLITDILDFSKVEAGRMEIARDSFRLDKMVGDVTDLMKPLADRAKLDLRLEIAPGVPQAVYGDPLRLRQIFVNLIGNAVKFTHAGHVTWRIAPLAQGKGLRFSVEDSGIGIPKDQLPSVFEQFEQVHTGREREYEGTGLGLAITQKLVQAMGGTIQVSSTLGEGTCFDLDLPLAASTEALPDDVSVAPLADLTGTHVLVVEDNRTNQLVARKMLEKVGARVTLANNGADAVEVFGSAPFDVILMDLSMPVMSGIDACRLIRAREREEGLRHTPMIALTGNAFDADRKDAMDAGMNGFLSKPIQRRDLVAGIAAVLR